MSAAGPLSSKRVLLVVSGGISAYKSALLARELLRRGAELEVVLTEAAQRFVQGLTFAGLTGRAPHTELWDAAHPGELHVHLAEQADAVVVAPATADLLARMAHGLANDLATATLLCTGAPVLVAPAMHTRMSEHGATQSNLATLRARGVRCVGPEEGPLASGASGMGRMSEPERIADAVQELFVRRDLEGVRLLVTAGPTHEALDPVRFVGNRSSGKMGFAVAERARARGAEVTVVHGPVSAAVPAGVRAVSVRSAREMFDAVLPERERHDVLVMAAAVADYRPAEAAPEKIKKGQEELVLRLVKNPDILATLGAQRGDAKRPVLVGFAVETGDLVGYARGKLERKGCDMVVANLAEHSFEGQDNTVTLVLRDRVVPLERAPKSRVADAILDEVVALLERSKSA